MEELKLNTNFIGFNGIIGRRDYFINILYTGMISILATIPATWSLLSNMETAKDAFNFGKLFSGMPVLLKIWYILILVFCLFVFISNIIRRLNDISGKINKTANMTVSALFIIKSFAIFLPLPLLYIFEIISFIAGLFLLIKKGAITGNYPYNFTKAFNWGAFFGTWIWGLFNKSYKTLWMLLLGLTPAGLYYAIICGLKGNEWAYKNKQWESDEKFKQSQDIQTIIFAILKVVIMPLIYFSIIFALIFSFISVIGKEIKSSPEKASQTLEKIGDLVIGYNSLYFESHKIEKNENKFYILPKDWASYSFKDKKDIFDTAATAAALERMKKHPGKPYSKRTELARTKIYNSKNGELLGEFSIDNIENLNSKNVDFKTLIKTVMTAYKFYKPTIK